MTHSGNSAKDVFLAALEHEGGSQRAAYLDRACAAILNSAIALKRCFVPTTNPMLFSINPLRVTFPPQRVPSTS
ncbi:MAG: hypothetical protein U0792_12395 [Gemmataceae bacterium]